MQKFVFKPLAIDDLSLMHKWFNDDVEVNKWYALGKPWSWADIERRYLPRLLSPPKENIPSYLVYYHNEIIGFIQYYSLADFLPDGMDEDRNHKLFEHFSPAQVGGVDMFNIAAAQKIFGPGAGSAILTEFLDLFVRPLFEIFVLDPAKNNARAIRCYEKCGFSHFSTEKKDDGAEVYLMVSAD